MAKLEYSHLIKPLLIKDAPAGLYTEPRVWMEGKDMEGFNANFSFGFVRKPGSCHPVEGAIIHPYDECLVFVGTDNNNILYLGGEISIELGEEGEEHVFTEPSVVIIPKGTPHGPATFRRVDRPIAHYTIGLSADYKAAPFPREAKVSKTSDSKYGHLIKRMITYIDWKEVDSRKPGETPPANKLDYSPIADRAGVLHFSERGVGPGNGDQVVWLYGKDLEGFEVNFTWGFYSKCGTWNRGGESHVHPEEEMLVFIGLDPDRPDYLGAEVELAIGKDRERHIINRPTVAICPRGLPHLPIITRWADRPFSFIVCVLGGEYASPWVEA